MLVTVFRRRASHCPICSVTVCHAGRARSVYDIQQYVVSGIKM